MHNEFRHDWQGGNHGYLTLLLSTEDYNAIPGTAPFIRPTDPGILDPIGTRGGIVPGGIRTRSG